MLQHADRWWKKDAKKATEFLGRWDQVPAIVGTVFRLDPNPSQTKILRGQVEYDLLREPNQVQSTFPPPLSLSEKTWPPAALDAAGKQLTARMEASVDISEIDLVVDDRSATYPIVIDPIVATLEKYSTEPLALKPAQSSAMQ